MAEQTITKPTPTQEENDLAATGHNVLVKEPDGSAAANPVPEPKGPPPSGDVPPSEEPQGDAPQSRHMEAGRGRSYETRAAQSRQHRE